jgi:hypothetical protein
MFGMADDTTDDALSACLKAAADMYSKRAAKDADGDDDGDEKKASLTAARDAAEKRTAELEKQAKAANAEIAELKKANVKAEEARVAAGTKALTEQLEREGRITANEKAFIEEDVKAFGLEKATERWGKRPVVVPVTERGVNEKNGLETPESAKQKIDTLVEEMAKTAGISRSDARMRVLTANKDLANRAAALEQSGTEKRN